MLDGLRFSSFDEGGDATEANRYNLQRAFKFFKRPQVSTVDSWDFGLVILATPIFRRPSFRETQRSLITTSFDRVGLSSNCWELGEHVWGFLVHYAETFSLKRKRAWARSMGAAWLAWRAQSTNNCVLSLRNSSLSHTEKGPSPNRLVTVHRTLPIWLRHTVTFFDPWKHFLRGKSPRNNGQWCKIGICRMFCQ